MTFENDEQINNPLVASASLTAINQLVNTMLADLSTFPQFTYDNAALALLSEVYVILDTARRTHFVPSGSL